MTEIIMTVCGHIMLRYSIQKYFIENENDVREVLSVR
jgi:Zn-dependent M32 family carboxypeptidase